jgi:histidinol-phosphatase (PHP family)
MRSLFDNHNHCEFSFDGKRTTVEASSRVAFEKGLGGLCFADHCDMYVPEQTLVFAPKSCELVDIQAQQIEIERVQKLFPQIKILKGIEIGMHHKCREEVKRMMTENSFDQVIGSIHYIDNTDPFYGSFFEGRTWKEAYGYYLETLYNEMTAWGDFDIMGHYDYVVRYCNYEQVDILYKDFSDIFDEMLRYLVHNGKALEINTKSYQNYKGRQANLDMNILKRYREMGGEIISFGSDSHDAHVVGTDFEKYAALAKSAGFRWAAHYEKRQLVQLPL